MGHWDVLHHLFECSSPERAEKVYAQLCLAEEYPWCDSNRWGVRFGFLSPTLVAASTSQKYGWEREFADFVISDAKDVALTQMILDSEEDGPNLWTPKSEIRSLHLQWDHLFFHSREEIHWDKSPVKTIVHEPPGDVAKRLVMAIAELKRAGKSGLLFRLPTQKQLDTCDGGPNRQHREAIRAAFADLYNIGPSIEDRVVIAFGMLSKSHGALHFGCLNLDDDDDDFELTLGCHSFEREVWLGPYLQPLRDDLRPIPQAVEFDLATLTEFQD